MDRLRGKVTIVTGGASGIGNAIAKAFALEGARVCVADISQAKCDEAARDIGKGCFGHAMDVRNRRSIDALINHVSTEAGSIDVLVNCAGVFGMQRFTDITEEEFDRIFAVNTRGFLFMSQAAARRMIEQGGGGSIINIASGVGRRTSPGAAIYSASKAAVISITQAAAQELIAHNIRVNAIAPGGVYTPMLKQVESEFAQVFGCDLGGAEKMQISATPAGRLSTPDEYAGAAIFFACQDSSYVVGQTLNVDGGMFLS